MIAINYLNLARFQHKRGMRMLACSKSVESCGHGSEFKALAKRYFGFRDAEMATYRLLTDRRVMRNYMVRDENGDDVGVVCAMDYFDASNTYELRLESLGIPWRPYTLKAMGRVKSQEAL